MDNNYQPFVKITFFHLDNIGRLYVLMDFYNINKIAEKFKQDKIKIFNKCEDGNLKIKIKFIEIDFINENKSKEVEKITFSEHLMINIFLSTSMSPKLNATKFILNYNCIDDSKISFERLTIIYAVNSNILNKNHIFENTLENLRISDCFDKLAELNKNENSLNHKDKEKKNLEEYYLKSINKIFCLNCNNEIFYFNKTKFNSVSNFDIKNDQKKVKILENFDFDYADKLENLSCHESHTEDIIPNIDEKLKLR